MQMRTREMAEKLRLTKSKSDNTEESKSGGRIGGLQMRAGVAGVMGKNAAGAMTQHAIQGIKIENDPLEREIYAKCPGCGGKVFDSGLENELECDTCNLKFVSGKQYTPNQLYLMQQKSLERMEEKDDEDDEEYDSEEEEEENEERKSPAKKGGKVSVETDKEALLTPLVANRRKQSQKAMAQSAQNFFYRKESDIASNPTVNETPSSDKASPSKFRTGPATPTKTSASPSQPVQRKNSSQGSSSDSSSKYVNELEDVVLFCNIDTIIADFLDPVSKEARLQMIQQSLLMPFFQLRTRILEKGTYFKIGGIEFYVAACEPYDFGKVASKTCLRCTQAVSKSDVIQRVNLVPLRRLDNSRTAIFETAIKPHLEENPNFYIHKNQILEFDEYEFYVKYARPLFGKIDLATTDIKIDSSTPKPVQVLRIAPIWNTDRQYEIANTKKAETFEYIKKTYIHPYFYCGFMCYVERGETIKIDDQEFFLNDCRPKYGIVDKQTIFELEVGFTQEVFKKKQVLADQRFAEKIQSRDVTTTQQQPISASAIRQRVAMFGNAAGRPHASQEYMAEIEEMLRMTASQGQDVMDLFDPNGAQQLRVPQPLSEDRKQAEGNPTPPSESSNQRQINPNDEYRLLLLMQHQAQIQQRILGHSQAKGQPQVTPKAIVQALPEHPITDDYMQRQAQCEDDGFESNRKCMVCIMDYEEGESVRTMPCLHFFHTNCIDEWLLQRACTCPICKFDIRKNYNQSMPYATSK